MRIGKDPAFTLYAMESEGDIPTRKGKLNAVAKKIAALPDPNNFAAQCRIYDEVGIDSDTFTEAEMEYLQEEIVRRILR